jgi:hypothetical protein
LTDSDDSDLKHVCFACVGEEFLSAEIKKDGNAAKCSYCGKKRRCFSIEELADRVESAFDAHYQRTSTEPDDFEYMMQKDKESDYEWSRHGEGVVWAIAEAAEVDEAVATDVQKLLEERHSDFESAQMGDECEFDSDSHYESKGPDDIELRENWRYFERSLKTETRFFNRSGEMTLASIFEGLADHETRGGRRVVIEAGPGEEITSLFRARVFQSPDPLKQALERPDIGLGPPPYGVATAGRMNAAGISVFYGALDPRIALAEIRPPVGSRVVVGQFTILRKLRLLDVEALKSVFIKGSIFDPSYIARLERAKFLGRLSDRISRAVMPNDELSDYLVTQAIADYLASEVRLDGIVYPSVQAGSASRNIVLFHRAARVKEIELPYGTNVDAHLSTMTEDGPEANYWVWEEVPAEKPKPKETGVSDVDSILAFEPASILEDFDDRQTTLEFNLASLHVHHIEAVEFTTETHSVRRHRSIKGETPF